MNLDCGGRPLLDRQKPIDQLLPVEVANAVDQTRSRWQLEDHLFIPDIDKGDRWMTDRLEMELVLDVAALGILGPEKFPPRRQVVKERADFDLGSRRFPAVAHRFDLSAVNDNLGSGD